jgi:ribosomal protein S18 acetylase RimI-like enzyme
MSWPQLVLRSAQPRDLDALESFELLVFSDLEQRISRRQWAYLVARAGGRTVMAEDGGGRLLGVLVLSHRRDGRSLRVYSLGVHPAARRQGVARRLLEHALAYAGRRGFERVSLEVRRENRGAVALYRAMGFSPVGTLRHYYGLGEDALRMECPVTAAAAGRHSSAR